jgi:hypothetical protein
VIRGLRWPRDNRTARVTDEVDVPAFPSVEWIDAFCQNLATHPRAVHVATTLGGVYRFIVDPGGPLVDRRQYDVALSVSDGEAVVKRIEGAEHVRVTVRTDYPRWQQLLRGELDLGPAMLFGRVRISGDLATLLNAGDDVDVVLDALRAVDTDWLEAHR